MSNYKFPETVDFKKVLVELNDWGFSDTKINELTGVERTMLGKLRRGIRDEPTYNSGALIMTIYNKERKSKHK